MGPLEHFVHAVRDAIETEAARNRDNRWWVLAPTLVVERRDGSLDYVAITPALAERPLGRALVRGEPRAILDALGARRAAVAMHVDLEVDEAAAPAIVVAAFTPIASSFSYAPVARTDAGTPRLEPWLPTAPLDDELSAALTRILKRG